MFKNYLKIAFRNFGKHRSYTAINVLGLTLGISACLYIYLITSFEFSYDNFHPGKERIFRIVSDAYSQRSGQQHESNIVDPYPRLMRTSLTGLKDLTVFYNYGAKVTVYGKNGLPVNKEHLPAAEQKSDLIIADPSYFRIFKYQWLAGNPATAMQEPFQVVLTTSKARKYFGERPVDEMIGKRIVYNDSLAVVVAGIVKDLPKNSDLIFTQFISFSTVESSFLKNWLEADLNRQVFVSLESGVRPSEIESRLDVFVKSHVKVEKGTRMRYRLEPLADLHFNSDYEDSYSTKAHRPTIYGVICIAVFILVVAVANFINLSTALSTTRLKEVGVRKVCGSSRTSLVLQSLGETFLLTFFASMFSVICLRLLAVIFPSLMPEMVSATIFSMPTFGFLFLVALFTSVLAGFYPARIISSYLPVQNLKAAGKSQGGGGVSIRKSLIVFQFTISLVFIIGAIVVGNQVRFMLNKDMGFTKDAIITIRTYQDDSSGKKHVLAQQLRQLSGVEKVSLSEGTPLAKDHWHNPLIYRGKQLVTVDCQLEFADADFISLYQIKLLAGRNLLASDSAKEILVNTTCMKALGFATPNEAIGKTVETILSPTEGMKSFPIVGVVADFHIEPFQKSITPAFILPSNEFSNLLSVRLATADKGIEGFKTATAGMERIWAKIYPDEKFEYSFFDESIRRLYQREERLSLLLNISMVMAIFISCIGLFGLTAFMVQRRAKEIAIRKVLGAGISNIISILMRETISLILLSIIIASPIAWLFAKKWLANFSYRLELSAWVMIIAGLMVVLIAMATIVVQVFRAAISNPVRSIKSE